MAFEGVNLAALDKLIRENLDKVLVKMYAEQSLAWDLFDKEKRPIANNKFYVPLKVGRATGFGARFTDAYDDSLPTAGAARYERTHIPVRQIYQAMRISGLAKAISNKDEAAIVDAFVQAAQDATEAMAFHLERMAIGDGSGRLCQVNGAVSGGTSIVVDHPWYDNPTQFLDIGLKIEIYNGATKEAGPVKITNIDPDTNTITVDQAVTVSDNAWIYIEEDVMADGSNLVSKEFMGLMGIVDSDNPPLQSDFQGIDATSNYWWRATVYDLAGGSLTLEAIQKTLDRMAQKNAGKINIALCNPDTRLKYVNLLQSMSTIQVRDAVTGAGWSGVYYVNNGRKIVLFDGWDIPKNTIIFVDRDAIKFFLIKDLDWIDYGGTTNLVIPGKDAIYRYLYAYGNLGTTARNKLGKLINIG